MADWPWARPCDILGPCWFHLDFTPLCTTSELTGTLAFKDGIPEHPERVMGVLPVAGYVEIVSFTFLALLLTLPAPDGNSIWNEWVCGTL